MSEREPILTPSSLLKTHDFILRIADGLPLTSVDFTEEYKRHVAERVLSLLSNKGLDLSCDKPTVYLVIKNFAPSKLNFEGKKCVDLDGTIYLFTNTGPVHAEYKFAMLAEDVTYLGKEKEDANEKGNGDVEPLSLIQSICQKIRSIVPLSR